MCGDLIKLPYRDETFDFLSALDVLEHIKKDEIAIAEISRILRKNAQVVITVPHRMKYYTNQDRLIGHYRRYEISQVITLFKKHDFKNIKICYDLGNARSMGYYPDTDSQVFSALPASLHS